MTTDGTIEIPLQQLRECPFNPRRTYHEASLAQLGRTILADGLLQPITVRPVWSNPLRVGVEPHDHYQIVFGHRRFRAARLAGLQGIRAFVRELDDETVARLQLIENVQREDVNPVEEGEAFERLIRDHGADVADLVLQTGKSRSHIFARRKLATVCQAVRDEVVAGTLGSEVALLIARLPAGLQDRALSRIKQEFGDPLHDGGKNSFRKLRALLLERFSLDLKKDALWALDDALLLADAGACSTCPKRSGSTPELYGDVLNAPAGEWRPHGADICMDVDCFAAKKTAHLRQQTAKLEDKGKTVVGGGKARQAIDAQGKVKGEYVALKDVRHQLKQAGAKPTIVTIQDPRTGKTVEAVKRSDLKAAGVKGVPAAPQKGERTDWEAERKKRDEEESRANERAHAELLVRFEILRRVRTAAAAVPRSDFDLQMMLRIALAGVDYNDRKVLATLWNADNFDGLFQRVGQLGTVAVTQLLLDCALVEALYCDGWSLKRGEKPETLLAAAKHYGVDVAAVRTELTDNAAPAPSKAAQATKGEAAKGKKTPAKARAKKGAAEPAAEERMDDDAGVERDPNTDDMFEEAQS